MPVYNGVTYLSEAIASVHAQTVGVTEILVVDDGSTDDSAQVAGTHPRVRVVRQANAGMPAALNRGVSELATDYIAFLDMDDLWANNRIERQLPWLEGEDPAALVFGHAQNFHSPDLADSLRQTIYCPPAPQAGYVMGTMLLRRETFHRIGPLRTDWKIGSHIEWISRASDLGLKLHMLPDVLLQRRLHANNFSRRAMASRPDFARVLKFVLDRRRQDKVTPELL